MRQRKGNGWNWIFLAVNLCCIVFFAMTGRMPGVMLNAAICVLHVHNIVEGYQ